MNGKTRLVSMILLVAWAGGLGAADFPFPDPKAIPPFEDSEIIDHSRPTRAIALGDLDGSGTTDIVACGWSAHTVGHVVHYSNLGDGVWDETIVDSWGRAAYTLAVGDVDGDGDGDILVGRYFNEADQPEVLWYANPKNGSNTNWVGYEVYDLAELGSRRVALGDVDRDGDLDVIFSYAGAGESRVKFGVIWVENDGDPSDGWGSSHLVWSSSLPLESSLQGNRGLAVADIDADGDLDIVVGNPPGSSPRVLWIENVSPVDWDVHSIGELFDSGGVTDMAVDDLNGDGLIDVVWISASSGSVFQFINANNGSSWSGNWVAPWYAPVVARAVSIHDLDGDGDKDILPASLDDDGSLVWFANSGGDYPSYSIRIIDSDGPYDVDLFSDIEAGDVDGDGDLDVLASLKYTAGGVMVFWRNRRCHSRFKSDPAEDIRTGLADPRAVEVADVNGDGLQDVITALWDGGEINAYVSLDPAANLWWESNVTTGFTRARDVSVADVNGDGDMDILGAAVGADAVHWWENDGGGIPGWTVNTVLEGYDGAHRVEPADFDRDGDIDLAVCAFDEDNWAWLENTNGMGTVWTRMDFPPLDGAFDLVVGDLNFDGAPDIVATGYHDNEIWAALNPMPGGSTWGMIAVAQGVNGPRGADLGDVDGDGDLDIVAVIRNDSDVLWFENDGTGIGWTQRTASASFPDGAAVRAVDLDQDGDTDIVATGQSARIVNAWINSSNGASWTLWPVAVALESAWDLDVADVDNDGRMDLIVAAGGTADRLVWYPNGGNQFRQRYWDDAPPAIGDGEKDVLFAIELGHHGRDGHDSSLEASRLTVEFTDGVGTPLTSSQINNLLDRLEIYKDTNESKHWEPSDAAIQFDLDISLTNGTLTWTLVDGLAVLAVDPGDSQFFFLVATALSAVGGEIIATLPAYAVEVEDVVFDVALKSEDSEPLSTGIVTIGSGTALIFADGFESGDSNAWTTGG